jgi:tetratricopeptide (TPR) repeat protein
VEQGRLDQAEPWLRIAGASGNDPSAALDLAHLYVNLGMPADAEAALSSVKTPPGSQYLGAARLAAKGNYPAVLSYGRERAAADREDAFWPQAIAIGCLMTGDWPDGAAQLPRFAPSLLSPEPEVAASGLATALMAAHLLSQAGDRPQGRRIAEAVLRATANPENGYLSGDARIARVKAFAELGDTDKALAELAAAVKVGWRTPFDAESYVWLDQDPQTRNLQQDPRFKSLMAQVRADLAAQRERLLAQRR